MTRFNELRHEHKLPRLLAILERVVRTLAERPCMHRLRSETQ
jgi:hypothetical protein